MPPFFEACGRRMASSAFRKMISVPQLLQSLRFGLVECLWITVGMTSSSDLEQIESRIVSLVKDFAFLHADDSVASSCRPIADMVAKQAVTSSEGGKRLRALLTLDSFRAFASEDVLERDFDALLDLACAVEVFQTGALVHDDIIDDSDLRRGKPSAHRAFSTDTHSETIGHGLGIMLGDMLATASVDIANKAACRLGSGSSVVSAFLNMHREVEIGQVLDLAVELNTLDDPEELASASLNVFRWKTASYTTIAPLEFGMLAAGLALRTRAGSHWRLDCLLVWRSSSRMIFWTSSGRAAIPANRWAVISVKANARCCWPMRLRLPAMSNDVNSSTCGKPNHVTRHMLGVPSHCSSPLVPSHVPRNGSPVCGSSRRPPSRRLNYRRIAKTCLPRHAHVSYRLCGNRADAAAL